MKHSYINFATAGVWLVSLGMFIGNKFQLNSATTTIALVMLVSSYIYHGIRDLKEGK